MVADVAGLFELAAGADEYRAWEAVRALRRLGSVEVFQAAAGWCEAAEPGLRARGLDILGQLGAGRPMEERPYFEECVSIALRHLADEDADVVSSAAWALAHLGEERADRGLLGVRGHADASVRHAVAVGLHGSELEEAALVRLMEDESDEVRDWATFGLGSQPELDSEGTREALRMRLDDPCEDVRSEAVWGLARRRDAVGLRMLAERLEAEEWLTGDEMEAAALLGVGSDVGVVELGRGVRGILGG